MADSINNIGIFSEEYNFESDYLPLISFKAQEQQREAEKYILQKVEIFFKKIIKINIDIQSSQITYPKIITEKDFPHKSIKYFYNNLFFNLGKRDSEGKLIFQPKWGITFDEKCAPISVHHADNKSKRIDLESRNYRLRNLKNYDLFFYYTSDHRFTSFRYGKIHLNGEPVFYYIYFTLQEILDAIQ